MNTRWSDCFLLVGITEQEDNSNPYRRTTRADLMLWEGSFEGHLMCVHSTVRLTGSNLAHFLIHSNGRIGAKPWSLRGGHYIDLRVLCRDKLTIEELRRLGELARTEETRPITVRQGKDLLADSISVPQTA